MKLKLITRIFLFSAVLLLSACGDAKVEDLQISLREADMPMKVGTVLELAAVVKAPDDFVLRVEWESSDDAVATVSPFRNDSQKAQLTAKSVGSCVITARAGERSQVISVEVVESKEITFYNKTGHPQIYLSTNDDNSFYTWDGYAVAYLYNEQIYGWRGKHIGWLIDGVIYDLQGYRVASIKEKCPYTVYTEYIKHIKHIQYSRYSRYAPYSKPPLSTVYSDVDFVEFITQDKV